MGLNATRREPRSDGIAGTIAQPRATRPVGSCWGAARWDADDRRAQGKGRRALAGPPAPFTARRPAALRRPPRYCTSNASTTIQADVLDALQVPVTLTIRVCEPDARPLAV